MAKNTWLLMAILIIASFLRLYNLVPVNNAGLPPGLYPDEAMNGNNAVEALETGSWKVFYPENFGREGLFINIQSLFVAAFGNTAWALRLPSAIFGILTVLGLYFFTRTLFHGNERLALLASFLLAVSFWHINFSRIGFRAITAPFFLTWGLYFLLKAFDSKRPYWNAIAGGIIYGLGFYSYIAYRATPLLVLALAAIFLLGILAMSRKKIISVFSLFLFISILVALPLSIHFFKNPSDFFGRTAGISVFNSQTPIRDLSLNIFKTFGMFNVVGDFNWRHNIAGKAELFWPIGTLFFIGMYLSAKKIILEKLRAFREIIIFGWFGLVLLPVIFSNEGLPHALRSLLAIPPVFIFAAIGGLATYDLLKTKIKSRLFPVFIYLFLSLLVFEAYNSYFVYWGENPNVKNAFAYNDFVAARQLNALPKGISKYVIVKDANGEIRRDYPISLQSVLFLTDTFSIQKRKEKNIFYIPPEGVKNIPKNSFIISL